MPRNQTLGDYLALAQLTDSPRAVQFFTDKIASAPHGAAEPVLADSSQMIALFQSLRAQPGSTS